MIQNSYGFQSKRGFPGLKHHSTTERIRAYAQGEASAQIAFGTLVVRATTTDYLLKPRVILPLVNNGDIAGAVVHSHAYNPATDLGTIGLLPDTALDIMEMGTIDMLVEEAVTPADPVYMRYAVGAGGTILGALRKTAVAGESVLVKGIRFITHSSPGLNGGLIAQCQIDTNIIRATA